MIEGSVRTSLENSTPQRARHETFKADSRRDILKLKAMVISLKRDVLQMGADVPTLIARTEGKNGRKEEEAEQGEEGNGKGGGCVKTRRRRRIQGCPAVFLSFSPMFHPFFRLVSSTSPLSSLRFPSPRGLSELHPSSDSPICFLYRPEPPRELACREGRYGRPSESVGGKGKAETNRIKNDIEICRNKYRKVRGGAEKGRREGEKRGVKEQQDPKDES